MSNTSQNLKTDRRAGCQCGDNCKCGPSCTCKK